MKFYDNMDYSVRSEFIKFAAGHKQVKIVGKPGDENVTLNPMDGSGVYYVSTNWLGINDEFWTKRWPGSETWDWAAGKELEESK